MNQIDVYNWKNNYHKLLNNYNSIRSDSVFMAKISSKSEFSGDNFKLPLLISGRLVTSDVYNEQGQPMLLPENELKKSISQWVGIKIYKSHGAFNELLTKGDTNIDNIVGKIISTEWNSADKGIDFVASIADRDIAYKIIQNLIESVSVGFSKNIIWTDKIAQMINIIPRELSLVINPRDKRANFKVVEVNY